MILQNFDMLAVVLFLSFCLIVLWLLFAGIALIRRLLGK